MTFELAKILLIIVVIVLTSLLLIIGTQVFLILSELRHALKKINEKLEGEGKAKIGILAGVRQIQGYFDSQDKEIVKQNYPHIISLKETTSRFFTRGGKPLK